MNFLELYDKPKQRSLANAILCYTIGGVTSVCAALFFLWPMPPGSQSLDMPVTLFSALAFLFIMIRSFEQGHAWRHPPCSKNFRGAQFKR